MLSCCCHYEKQRGAQRSESGSFVKNETVSILAGVSLPVGSPGRSFPLDCDVRVSTVDLQRLSRQGVVLQPHGLASWSDADDEEENRDDDEGQNH